MKVETTSLISVKNFAKQQDVSTSYVYRLIREGKLASIQIDDVYFISKSTTLPTR